MSDIAIEVNHVWKKFRKGEFHNSLRDLVPALTSGLLGLKHNGTELGDSDFWALKDIHFQVRRGEILGIIGPNGAGKSTVLKLLSRILKPNKGNIKVNGRLTSLIEVGAGFHPDLTGRENIYLNGTILGMKKGEIDKIFDEIVDFSGLEEFIDTPVKRYSSGMYARLGFSVAAYVDPEILLVDEVLSVGDASFQKKCLGKMSDVAKEGRTVLFVSHNLQAVSTLTQRSLMLSHGRCKHDGPTYKVISEYLRDGSNEELIYTAQSSPSNPKITRVDVRTSHPGNTQFNGQPMEVHFEINTPVPINGASLSFQAYNSLHQPMLHLWTFDSERSMCRKAGIFHLICHIPKIRLYLGQYTLTVHFSERAGGKKFAKIERICPFEVVMYGQSREFKWEPGTCAYLEESEWQIEEKDSL